MAKIRFTPIPSEIAHRYRSGGPDANGQVPERAVSDGQGNPCRHCLRFIPKDREMLILCHQPFPAPQPYAESGPVFLCADECAPWEGPGVPPIFEAPGEERLVKGYSPEDRIVYGLGKIVPVSDIGARALEVLEDPRVAYVHVRSSTNNCFTCRIDRA